MNLFKLIKKYFLFFAVHTMADGSGGGGGSGDGGDGGDGGSGDHWSAGAGLPEGVAGWDEVKNSDNAEAFYKQIGDMRSRMGKSVVIPGEDAGTADWDKFYAKLPEGHVLPAPTDEAGRAALMTKLGKPTESTGYTMPGDLKLSDTQSKAFRDVAFAANLTQSQFETYVTNNVTESTTVTENKAREFKEGLTALATEWGATYEGRVGIAEKVREKFFEFIPAEAMNAETVKAMFAISEQFGGEGSQILGQQGGSTGEMTPQEADAKIAEIRNNLEHPYHNPRDFGHKAARARMRELYLLKEVDNKTVTLGQGNGGTAGVGGVANFK